jgi:ATP adenylyltransferase
MDYLWTPWRYQYVSNATKANACVLCDALAGSTTAAPASDETNLVLFRGKKNFIILNRFPYTTGHVMICPYEHVPDLGGLDAETLTEMMTLARRMQMALAELYHPEGYNLGMNIGRCAGAGVASHVHLHVLPRWTGDTSFVTTVAETRVEPEDLATTYRKLKPFFEVL